MNKNHIHNSQSQNQEDVPRDLSHEIKNLLNNPKITKVIKNRIREFVRVGKSDDSEIFSELVFCILTANYTAKGGLRIQNALDKEIMYLSEEDIAKRLKELGHRFPNTRARYIAKARERLDSILRVVRDADLNCKEKREWLAKNVKGLGLKEASHFLRNIGCLDVAIIDFHIIDLTLPRARSSTADIDP